MKPFTDSQGRTWNVTVTVGAIKRVRDLLGVDLMDVANGDLLSRLADDPCLLVDVLFALCKPEADAAKVTDEDFGRAMVGDALDSGSGVLMKELLDFFPSALHARALVKMFREMKEHQATVSELATARTPGDSSGDSPESAASTPAASPSAS